ncbi:MAG TPA: serine/threonine-protein kinase, partial [Ktedonobacteraceae bacterium]|nr:serine/threonine-protein kinase [Ktedonobacteraceae bacterium]
MLDRSGQQFGKYRLLRLIGRGGFADVYLGEHVHLKNQSALKLLHNQLSGVDIDAFLKEAQTIARLDHPHIVRIFDFDVQDGIPFLVMGFAPNGTLRDRYPKRTLLPLSAIVSHVTGIADALQYAHNEKVVHRDIKPENMLLGRRNEIMLSDFGIAIVSQSSRYQSTQNIAGTMGYMSPEQIQAHPRPASDQYSLGVVVYEWLSGQLP